ncbi:undecaprenyl-diphosphate phosphatase [Ichthyobacterium seriolicida]|uniref:Undecaprenyl-diphosphatase n=1 Tax=Ichthyobacterium seriolicida TaxID=242600 RepID=A0A1J1DZ99_9FLAO|nr:undecaprenyl-diphosphate phosphatase [Ichthyobacterium seriolicida]BAV95242.1 undecaprenyl-diphosphatase [Ichthyobacterium seriolicida]
MGIIELIILAIVQGLTEFLPISSSGHLELVKVVLGYDISSKDSLLLTVVLHLATVFSTLVVFKKEIKDIFSGLFTTKWNIHADFSLKILLSIIPSTCVGLFLLDEIEKLFNGNTIFIGSMLILNGIILLVLNKEQYSSKLISFLDSFFIGVAQAIAILPGISRSGLTISTAVVLGNNKRESAKFSFLMVIPLVLAKGIKDISSGQMSFLEISNIDLAIAFIVSFLTGIIACRSMIKLVEKSNIKYFSLYCFSIGTVVVVHDIL